MQGIQTDMERRSLLRTIRRYNLRKFILTPFKFSSSVAWGGVDILISAVLCTLRFVQNPGVASATCAQIRRDAHDLLRPLRSGIGGNPKELRGGDFGITVGLRPQNGYIDWYDMVVMT